MALSALEMAAVMASIERDGRELVVARAAALRKSGGMCDSRRCKRGKLEAAWAAELGGGLVFRKLTTYK